MVFFNNGTLELYEYQEDSKELNPYKESTTTYKYVGSVACDFQTASTSDVLLEVGETLTDMYKAYIPTDTVISEGMKFKLTGKPHTYTLIGHEVVNTRFTPTQHQKLILQVDRKPDNRLQKGAQKG